MKNIKIRQKYNYTLVVIIISGIFGGCAVDPNNLHSSLDQCLKSEATNAQFCKYAYDRFGAMVNLSPDETMQHILLCVDKKQTYNKKTFDYCYNLFTQRPETSADKNIDAAKANPQKMPQQYR